MRTVMRLLPRSVLFKLATSERFETTVRAAPGGERVAYRLASRYVAGDNAEDALATARRLAGDGVLSSIDFFGENVTDPREADRVADAYVALAARIQAPTYLSIDLSHIAIDEPGDGARRRLQRIAEALPAGALIQVGAEQVARTDRILDAVLAVARDGGPGGGDRAGKPPSQPGGRPAAGRGGSADSPGQGRLRRDAVARARLGRRDRHRVHRACVHAPDVPAPRSRSARTTR